MSFSETIFLFFLALIIFGPKKLPEIARQIGKALNEFRRASNEFKAQIEQEIANLEVENKKQTILPPSPAPEGTASRALNAAPSETSGMDAAEPASVEGSTLPATLAASAEEPVAEANAAQPATEAFAADLPTSDLRHTEAGHTESGDTEPVTSSTTQESHA
jgi:sec-independent protein translocase protein TatB